jgi:hypothetical protein
MATVRAVTDPIMRGGGTHDELSMGLTGQALDSPYNRFGGQRRAQEAIARSDVPVEHLRGLQAITLHSGMQPHFGGLQTTLGDYEPSTREINIHPATGDLESKRGLILGGKAQQSAKRLGISRAQGVTRQRAQPIYDAALIHEIGHHVDFSSRYGGRAPAESQVQKELQGRTGIGKTEGKADLYALQRFQNDPRNQRRTGFNVQRSTYAFRGTARDMPGYPKAQVEAGEAERKRADVEDYQEEKRNQGRKEWAAHKRKSLARYKRQQAAATARPKNRTNRKRRK